METLNTKIIQKTDLGKASTGSVCELFVCYLGLITVPRFFFVLFFVVRGSLFAVYFLPLPPGLLPLPNCPGGRLGIGGLEPCCREFWDWPCCGRLVGPCCWGLPSSLLLFGWYCWRGRCWYCCGRCCCCVGCSWDRAKVTLFWEVCSRSSLLSILVIGSGGWRGWNLWVRFSTESTISANSSSVVYLTLK